MGRVRTINRASKKVSSRASGSTNTEDFTVVGWQADIDENIKWNMVCRRPATTGGVIRFIRCKPFAQAFHVEQVVTLASGETLKVDSFTADNEDQFFFTQFSQNGLFPQDDSNVNTNGNVGGSDMILHQIRNDIDGKRFGAINGDDVIEMAWNNPSDHHLFLVPAHDI